MTEKQRYRATGKPILPPPDSTKQENVFVGELEEEIAESVRLHRQSDVPVGSFLSGGVDSSFVTANLLPEHTFSVGFGSRKFDETGEAERLSDILGIKHHSKIITADEAFEAFPEIQYHMDEPQANPSAVPLWFLAELARKYVTVVLSGEGADEIFGGYDLYGETPMQRKYKRIPAPIRRAAASVVRRLPYFKGHDFIITNSGYPEDFFIGQAYVFHEKEALRVLKEKYRAGKSPRAVTAPIYGEMSAANELTKKQLLDISLWLPGDILLKADKMSMAHSLELRVPYLDREVMEFAESVPSSLRVNERGTKYVLRRAALHNLPEEWANRPKKGFPVPIRDWLREDKYCDIVREYFSSDFAAEFFDTEELLRVLDAHKSGLINGQRKIWVVFTFLVWYRQFFIEYKKTPI